MTMTIEGKIAGLRHFADLRNWGAHGVEKLVALARKLKAAPPKDLPLRGKSLAFCFMNPSLRTQVSFEVAAASLGAHPVTLFFGQGTWNMESRDGAVMDGAATEHLKDAVPVLGRYCDAVALRAFPSGKTWEEDRKEPQLSPFLRYSTVPVINMESSLGHPCQGLADLMTIQERMDPRRKRFVLTWAPHIKHLPSAVPHSAAQAAVLGGMDLVLCRPEGYDLDGEVMAWLKEESARRGTKVEVTDDPEKAYEGAHVVYAKSWGALSSYGTLPPQDAAFRDRWRVSAEKMRRTERALLMHCLPVRRNLVAADGVLDGPGSVIIDQAENRLHAAKALLLRLLAPEACHA